LKAGLVAERIAREDIFITTKLWNSNHRPERVEPAFEASLDRLGQKYLDLYLVHTPYAFRPGDDQDPRDQNGNVIYDHGVTLLDTWRAMESLVDHGKCRAIGLSDIGLEELRPVYESARVKPAVVQVESHPYLPETELLEFCKEKGIVFLAFSPLGHGMRPGLLEDPVIIEIATRVVDVSTWLDSPSKPVTLVVQFATLPDGTDHPANITLSLPSSNLEIAIANSNYQRVTH